MKVNFKNNWFAPRGEYMADKLRTFSGQRFRRGEQIVPDALFDYLPSSAVVMEAPKNKKIEQEIPVPPQPSLKDFDNDRPALMKEAEIQNAAHDNMAKARAARKAKAEERKAR